jgi:hypothetical protein
VTHNLPTPPRHGWNELLRLLDEIKRLAFDRSLDDADRARRLRAAINEHDGMYDDHDEN